VKEIMIHKFIEDCELEVVVSYDEISDSTESEIECFCVGDTADFDIVDDNGDNVDVQFGDGSVSYGVPKRYFKLDHPANPPIHL